MRRVILCGLVLFSLLVVVFANNIEWPEIASSKSLETSILVHVKLFDHVIMTNKLLESLTDRMGLHNYKTDIQFNSGPLSQYLTCRLTFSTLQSMRDDYSTDSLLSDNIQFIRKVSTMEKMSFHKLDLESLKFSELEIFFGDAFNNYRGSDMSPRNLPFETKVFLDNTVRKVRNTFTKKYQETLLNTMKSIDFQQVSNSFQYLVKNGRNYELLNIPTSLLNSFSQNGNEMNDELLTQTVKSWFQEEIFNHFDLSWSTNEFGHLKIAFSQVDTAIWREFIEMEETRKAFSPFTASHNHKLLLKRESFERLLTDIPQMENILSTISSQLGQELINCLTELDSVDFIGRHVSVKIDNLEVNQALQSGGGINGTYFWNYGIDGSGEVVGYTDTGIDPNHCYFYGWNETYTQVNFTNRKIVFIDIQGNLGDYGDTNSHGTHVAGTIAGSLPRDTTYNGSVLNEFGVAPGAKLYVVDGNKPPSGGISFPSVTSFLNNAFTRTGARISSNSWGCYNLFSCTFDCICSQTLSNGTKVRVYDEYCIANYGRRCCNYCNQYNYYARDVDSALNTNDEIVFHCSAGNDGDFSRNGTLGGAGASKNGITVGSSSSNSMSSFSSRGPTMDGRIKPDISSPGSSILSAASGTKCGLSGKSGTSMACPGSAGASALIRHYFSKDNKKKLKELEMASTIETSTTLAGTLVKAALLHAGDKLTGSIPNIGVVSTIPNIYYGFGRINLRNSLIIDSDPNSVNLLGAVRVINRYPLSPTQKIDFKFRATSNTPVKVTMAWYDLPSIVDTGAINTKKLINDMDLLVTVVTLNQTTTTKYYGNGAITGNTDYDSLNTVEQVMVANVQMDSNVTISVSAKSSNKGSQTFSLIMSGKLILLEEKVDNVVPTPSPSPTPQSTIPIPKNSGIINKNGTIESGASGMLCSRITVAIVMAVLLMIGCM